MRRRSFLAVPAALALVATGCTSHHVTETVNGHTVTPVSKPDLDACDSITSATLAAMALEDVEPTELVDPARPGCEWTGRNPYVSPDLIVRTLGPGKGEDPQDEVIKISGATVSVYTLTSDGGRYIVPCGDHNLLVNYVQAKGPLAAKDALAKATRDVIDAYGCAGG